MAATTWISLAELDALYPLVVDPRRRRLAGFDRLEILSIDGIGATIVAEGWRSLDDVLRYVANRQPESPTDE
jgi:hypothetical protein